MLLTMSILMCYSTNSPAGSQFIIYEVQLAQLYPIFLKFYSSSTFNLSRLTHDEIVDKHVNTHFSLTSLKWARREKANM